MKAVEKKKIDPSFIRVFVLPLLCLLLYSSPQRDTSLLTGREVQ